jgi:hypothetical protein
MFAGLAHLRLLIDIWSMALFVWLLGRNGELLDSHLFYFDRYSDLADHHRRHARVARAERLTALAEEHFRLAPDDDRPPEAATIAMPVPRPVLRTRAVGTTYRRKPPVGPSNVAPSPAG